MGCFRIDLQNPLELLFYGLSLLQAFRAVQLAGRIRKEWAEFRQAPMTRQKMHLAEQAAFYLAIPPSVLVHEYFHAIPIWSFGGRIVNCGYGFYWGFVQADRFFLPSQEWLISLGGTLGSLLFAAVLFGLLYRNQSRTLRYFARRSLRTLLHYSLIYYPIFTAVTFIGDWRTIYNFGSTPVLSAGTAVVHLGLLLLFWQATRRGWFEMVGQQNEDAAAAFAELEAKWRQMPHDPKLGLAYVEALRMGGAAQKAAAVLQQLLRTNPNMAGAHLQLAFIETEGKRNVPLKAVRRLEKALQLGLDDMREQALAHQLLGQYQLDMGKGELALQHLDQAVGAIEAKKEDDAIHPLYRARLYHMRSLAYQRLRQPELAYQNAQQAITWAQNAEDEKAIAYYQRELEIMQKQDGRL